MSIVKIDFKSGSPAEPKDKSRWYLVKNHHIMVGVWFESMGRFLVGGYMQVDPRTVEFHALCDYSYIFEYVELMNKLNEHYQEHDCSFGELQYILVERTAATELLAKQVCELTGRNFNNFFDEQINENDCFDIASLWEGIEGLWWDREKGFTLTEVEGDKDADGN